MKQHISHANTGSNKIAVLPRLPNERGRRRRSRSGVVENDFFYTSNRLLNKTRRTHSVSDRRREKKNGLVRPTKGRRIKRRAEGGGDRKTAEGSTGNPFKKSNKVKGKKRKKNALR
jgi:hypothetical protein